MARSDRLKITLSGDLARVLLWEADRCGRTAQEIASGTLERALSDVTALWREARLNGREAPGRPSEKEIQAVASVLSKAYGPVRRRLRHRRVRTGG